MKQGIIPATEEDKKACAPYAVGSIFALDPLSSVPQYYRPELPSEWIYNQTESDPMNDECAGVALAVISSLQEGKHLDPHFHWMMARVMAGMGIGDFGVSNRTLSDTARKVGSLLHKDSPYTFLTPRDIIADPTKWDITGLLPKSKEYIKGSIVWIKPQNGMDSFDVFRASVKTLNRQYGKPHGAVLGIKYLYPSTATKIDDIQMDGTPHDTAVIGWEGDYAVVVNSLGPTAHNKGTFLLHRSVFNKWAEVYMAFIPVDATPEQVKYAIESGAKIGDPWHKNLLISITRALLDLYNLLLKKKMEDTGYPPVLLWDTPEHARYSVRVLCDRAGLSFDEKAIICACIYQESQFNNNAVCRNRNAKGDIISSDWGLVQVNDYWHIGPGKSFPSVAWVVAHPEEMVNWMISMYKKGNLKLWVSYSSGAYKKHLARESRPGTPY